MKAKALLVSAAALAAVLGAASANAETITAGSGWQYDEATKLNYASSESPWSFTVPTGKEYIFSLTDGFLAGDDYTVTINGFITAPTTYTLYPTTFDNNTGPSASLFASDWKDISFSHLQLTFGSGSYSLVVKDIKDAGLPAGFGVRVDAVPEASTWAMLIAGFAGLAVAGSRVRRTQAVAV